MKDLILVESPTKARTLNSFLQGAYDIEASMGHIQDLPKSKIGVDIEHKFSPEYTIADEKKEVLNKLLSKAKKAKLVILATDPDREGEAISYHLYKLLKEEIGGKTFRRIVFHEITKEAIDEALEHARDIDMNLVSAQTARRVLDRIVGYKLSPLLWKKVRRNLSAGRVQSVALRLIVEREREIEKFKKEGYVRIFVSLVGGEKKVVEFELIQINEDKVEVTTKIQLYDGEYTYAKTILNAAKAQAILEELKTISYTVTDVQKKDTKRSPYGPFITSTLQQEAARRLFFPSRKTMNLAQKLYEEGFITYHRTDSYNLSAQFISRARAFIEKEFGQKYLSDSPRVFKTKSKVAQEAHEAIRPTKVERLEVARKRVADILGREAVRLFELIYKRALVTQMADALFESTTVLVEAKGKSDTYIFKVSGSILRFDGFLKLWFVEENENLLPAFIVGEKLKYEDGKITEHETNPPPRYTEASLIGALEKNGIGRPSTYASIVNTITDRAYVEKKENRFVPTGVGTSVNDFLVKNFSDIDDIPFTAEMEDKLDKIANGELKYAPMMEEFYSPFEKQLEKAADVDRVEVPTEKTDKKCPKCDADVVIRMSRFGKFLSCSRFPDCDYKASYAEEINFTCPRDGGKVVAKRTRKGRVFYGCSNYPKCDFAVWKLTDLQNGEASAPKKPRKRVVKTA